MTKEERRASRHMEKEEKMKQREAMAKMTPEERKAYKEDRKSEVRSFAICLFWGSCPWALCRGQCGRCVMEPGRAQLTGFPLKRKTDASRRGKQ